jgi:predicted alpha/beta-hydrolase family hydrolase
LIHRPKHPIGVTFVFAPSAGADSKSDFMVAYAKGLSARGVLVITFDFPYKRAGRPFPDSNDVLEATFRKQIAAARKRQPDSRLFIGGKSMGGRTASQVAAYASGRGITGVIALGYPLHPIGKPNVSRDEHLVGVAMPMLFVHGTHDTFATPAEIRRIARRLPKGSAVHVVAGGHSFKSTDADAIQDVIVRWIGHVVR